MVLVLSALTGAAGTGVMVGLAIGGTTVACVYACREARRVGEGEGLRAPRPEAREEQTRRPGHEGLARPVPGGTRGSPNSVGIAMIIMMHRGFTLPHDLGARILEFRRCSRWSLWSWCLSRPRHPRYPQNRMSGTRGCGPRAVCLAAMSATATRGGPRQPRHRAREIQANGAWYPVEYGKVLRFLLPRWRLPCLLGHLFGGRPNFPSIILPGVASFASKSGRFSSNHSGFPVQPEGGACGTHL